MKRRGLLAALAVSTSVTVAGCAGQDQSFDLDAEPAQIPESAYADGYSGQGPQEFSINEGFNATGVNVEVSATTWVTQYTNEEIGSALFVASTPNESFAGESVNPLVRAEGADLIRQLLDRIDQQGIGGNETEIQTDDIEEAGEETQDILGEETTVSILETTVSADVDDANGQSGSVEDIPVLVYIATVEDDDDVVVMTGVHPEKIDQSDQLLSMMGSVEH
ncbi:hypothetical protein EKH57_07405 [Halorubrum sp. BOL3-1]|uniref:DUF6517 family protein n=1 Tax=Halorubrum sp. BOL3-1 TaxID=2497325 RepID=UPI001004DD78|nr:DUF6517 family protein [Halorubrum sp. BOL3-1]QAU12563.1 hypothetical protein EKH57_07405 [Halorubrum sp. BOL3-1]